MKIIPFNIPFCTTSDINLPISNLSVLTTQPLGWMSARFCTYPQEILIQLQNNTTIKKIQILSNEKKISSKVEVYIGRLLKQHNQDINALGLDGIQFDRIGYFTFNSNEQSNWQARELKTVQIDQSNCNFVKLLLNKNYDNRYNPFCQVGIVALRIYGDIQQLQPPSLQTQRIPVYQGTFQIKDNEYKDERLIDAQAQQQIYALQYQKELAIKEEDFDEAKRIKTKIDELRDIGIQLKDLEDKKQFSIQNEDYDTAYQLKNQISAFRIQLGQTDGPGKREFKQNKDQQKNHTHNDMVFLFKPFKMLKKFTKQINDEKIEQIPNEKGDDKIISNNKQNLQTILSQNNDDEESNYTENFQYNNENDSSTEQNKKTQINNDDVIIPS